MLILLLAIFPFLGIGANLDAISSNSSMTNSSSNINSIQQDLEWESYKAFYAKVYAPHEEVSRRSAWESNQKIIAKHNLEAGQGKHTYTLGMNVYGDLTHEEFLQAIGSTPMNTTSLKSLLNTTITGSKTFHYDPRLQTPTSIDWRKKGIVTRVKNQGSCGSCWAFSTTGALESQRAIRTGVLEELSEQQLVDCSGGFASLWMNHGCNGGVPVMAMKYIKDNGGIDSEASYAYEAKDDNCRYQEKDKAAKVASYSGSLWGNEVELTQALAAVGPISVCIDASHSNFHLYYQGIYYNSQCSSWIIDHAVLAVGYGSMGGKDYYIVKNSWGKLWGQDGYILMARNRGNNCGIATFASFPIV